MNNGETSRQNEDAQAENPWDILTDVPQNDGETDEKTRQFKKLEELLPIFNAENVGIYGHGTGSTGDSHEVVDSIFEDGLRAYESPGSQVSEDRDPDEPIGDTDLFSTSVCLHSTEGGKQIDLSSFRESLDHWPHRESRNVVLFRLPFEYFNVSPIHSERDLPFFVKKRDKYGQMRYYIDSRLIIGSYDAQTGLVEMNDAFEEQPSDELKADLSARLEEAHRATVERANSLDNEPLFGFRPVESGQTPSEDLPIDPNAPIDEEWVE